MRDTIKLVQIRAKDLTEGDAVEKYVAKKQYFRIVKAVTQRTLPNSLMDPDVSKIRVSYKEGTDEMFEPFALVTIQHVAGETGGVPAIPAL